MLRVLRVQPRAGGGFANFLTYTPGLVPVDLLILLAHDRPRSDANAAARHATNSNDMSAEIATGHIVGSCKDLGGEQGGAQAAAVSVNSEAWARNGGDHLLSFPGAGLIRRFCARGRRAVSGGVY